VARRLAVGLTVFAVALVGAGIARSAASYEAQQHYESLEVVWFEESGCVARGADLAVDRSTGTEPIQISRVWVFFSEWNSCLGETIRYGGGTIPIGAFDLPQDLATVRITADGSVPVTSGGSTQMVPVVVDLTFDSSTSPQSAATFTPHHECSTAVEGLTVPCNRTQLTRVGGDVTGTLSLDGLDLATLPLNYSSALWQRNTCIVPEGTPNDAYGRPCNIFEVVIF